MLPPAGLQYPFVFNIRQEHRHGGTAHPGTNGRLGAPPENAVALINKEIIMQKPTPLPTHVLPTVDFLQAVNLLPTVVLSANQVRLEPLTLQHEAGLRQAVQDGELWKMLVTTAPAPEDVARACGGARFPARRHDGSSRRCS